MTTRVVALVSATIIQLLTQADLGELTLLCAISAHSRVGACRASIPKLAAWLQIHPRTARKRMNALVALGYVREWPVRAHARAEREIMESDSGAVVQVEVDGLDCDDAFALYMLLLALGLPFTGPLDELARTARVSRPTLNGLLDKLVERKFVTLERKSRALFCIVPTGTFGSQKKSAQVRQAESAVDYSGGKWARIAEQLRTKM